MEVKKLILVGGGGHCKSVIDVAESAGYTILGILDRLEDVGKRVLGYEVIGTDDDMGKYADKAVFIVTVGQIKSPDLRIKLHQMLAEAHCHLATIIAPTAHVSKYATIGEGTVVMHKAVINADAHIGRGCIINTFANIEHDAVVGNYCHISTGAMINGGAIIADRTFIGSQSVVNQGVKMVEGVVASMSVINKDITDFGIFVGVPAKKIK
jgi:sugar O-acyltransferase (sialic acid O-acetyltransferase NeuD family)